MNYPNLTDEKIMTMLREVVAERPDYVYEAPKHMVDDCDAVSCFYVHRDGDGTHERPGCLVGHVLNRLGVPLSDLVKHEDSSAFSVLADLAPDAPLGSAALEKAQRAQDSGQPWEWALVSAERP